jgi:hypothetical protein
VLVVWLLWIRAVARETPTPTVELPHAA